MNLVMKRFGANVTLPLMVTLWGMVCACQGAVKTYGGLLACRFFLGALEGKLHPLNRPFVALRYLARERGSFPWHCIVQVILLQASRPAASFRHVVLAVRRSI